jgi:hypothetical protein
VAQNNNIIDIPSDVVSTTYSTCIRLILIGVLIDSVPVLYEFGGGLAGNDELLLYKKSGDLMMTISTHTHIEYGIQFALEVTNDLVVSVSVW